MLKVTCFPSLTFGQYVYTEEFVDFSWYVKVNESATLIASIPTVVATLKIAKVDAGLRALRKDDRIRVQNTSNTGLVLLLRVTEVTIFERKKEVEIACSYASMGSIFDGIEGTLQIPENKVEEYDIASHLKPATGSLTNPEFLASVKSKEDLMLALAWAYENRRNLALTPFSTAVSRWNGTGEYVAIFPDQRHDGTEDGLVPIYVVEPEDIISYEITSADPPVTFLRSSALGKLKPMPQVPPQEVLSPSRVQLPSNVRAFYSKALGIGMTYTARYDSSQASLIDQKLLWSDGVSVESTSSSRIEVLGMFSNEYIVNEAGTVKIKDRISDTVLAQLSKNLYYFAGSASMMMKVARTEVLENDDVFVELAWLTGVQLSFTNIPVAVAKIRQKATGVISYSFIEVEDADLTTYLSMNSPWLSYMDRESKTKSTSVYGHYASGLGLVNAAFVTVSLTGTVLTAQVGGSSFSVSSYLDVGLAVDISVGDAVDHSDNLDMAELLVTLFIINTGTGTVTRKVVVNVNIEAGTFDSVSEVMDADMAIFLAPAYLIVDKDNDRWLWMSPGMHVIQSGTLSNWTGVEDMTTVYFGMAKGMLISVIDTGSVAHGSKVYDAYMQLHMLPFVSRDASEQYQKVQIAEGQENVIDLPFKVGAVDPSKVYIDKELGRIEVLLSKFYVFDLTEQDYVEKDVQLLNNMATGSYVRISLTPDDASDFVIAKVIGFKIVYSGVVEAKLFGIIVE